MPMELTVDAHLSDIVAKLMAAHHELTLEDKIDMDAPLSQFSLTTPIITTT